MSLIPDFELGLWTAWILILPFFLIWLSGGIINKRKWEEPPPTKMDKKTHGYRKVVEACLFLYPIFLPLKLGTYWFQYGFAVYLTSMSARAGESNGKRQEERKETKEEEGRVADQSVSL